jgi:hypothetical protein
MCLYSLIYYTFTLVINNYELYLSLILLYEKMCMLDQLKPSHRHTDTVVFGAWREREMETVGSALPQPKWLNVSQVGLSPTPLNLVATAASLHLGHRVSRHLRLELLLHCCYKVLSLSICQFSVWLLRKY